MTPTACFTAKIEEFRNLENDERMTVIHPGQINNVLVEIPGDVVVGAILRRERQLHKQTEVAALAEKA
jgi:hypothetical protein